MSSVFQPLTTGGLFHRLFCVALRGNVVTYRFRIRRGGGHLQRSGKCPTLFGDLPRVEGWLNPCSPPRLAPFRVWHDQQRVLAIMAIIPFSNFNNTTQQRVLRLKLPCGDARAQRRVLVTVRHAFHLPHERCQHGVNQCPRARPAEKLLPAQGGHAKPVLKLLVSLRPSFSLTRMAPKGLTRRVGFGADVDLPAGQARG